MKIKTGENIIHGLYLSLYIAYIIIFFRNLQWRSGISFFCYKNWYPFRFLTLNLWKPRHALIKTIQIAFPNPAALKFFLASAEELGKRFNREPHPQTDENRISGQWERQPQMIHKGLQYT